MREIMSREECCEFFGINLDEFGTLFPAPPSFDLAGHEKFRLTEIAKWLDERIRDQDQVKTVKGRDLYKLAQVEVKEQRYAAAVPILVQAIGLDRLTADYHFNLGFCLYKTGEYDRSNLSFCKALELDPKGDWRDAAKNLISEIDKMKLKRVAEAAAAAKAAPGAAPAAPAAGA